ncbi:post-GPI attachment to proteins factor 2-like isoform X2 [Liolophura sinensis]|uniref:post-GPI attachment to proteins factor 2-like isoform X2 n=1 Tax=Liolophura sinensis TaxID=3198878 RepID=UPI003158A536
MGKAQGLYLSVSWRKFAILVLSLPLFGFFVCVIWSILFNFEGTTATHCKVANYLPSASAAIGGYTPQIYIWRICIALHSAPRLIVPVIYYNFHTSVFTAKHSLYQSFAALAGFLHFVENLSLVGLTYISSTENHELHKDCFIIFMICSQLYMLLTCALFKWGRSGKPMSPKESKSYWWKKVLFGINIFSIVLAAYFFYRHNTYCEPGVYTVFSLLEYIVILTNLTFHATSMVDFEGLYLEFGQPATSKQQ